MKRSRLKNIINKSNELSNKSNLVGNPFDTFKQSLPKDLEIGEDYRLEAAWKAYGSPKNYKEALWEGMIQPIDENTYKLPSIGYNEETDEYEYLNKGKENETVAKDIRVWDNDVIPFVLELKLGGYLRIYNEEKDCWTYSKNKPLETLPLSGEISSFLNGGKPKRNMELLITYANNLKPPFILRILNNDERTIPVGDSYGTHLLGYGSIDGKTIVYPDILDINGLLQKLDFPKSLRTAYANNNYLEMSPEEAEEFTKNYKKYYPNYKPFLEDFNPQSFKQGGQMNVIPEGALHAHKNHMEGAGEDFTAKGIPVIDNEGNQLAEIERNEVIFNKDTTEKLEKYYKQFNEENKSQSEKDEIAIKAGKLLAKLLMENTEDRTNLIEEVKLKM